MPSDRTLGVFGLKLAAELVNVPVFRRPPVSAVTSNFVIGLQMTSIKNTIRRFTAEESGATMVEYGIMVALIAAVSIAVVKVVGAKTNNAFQNVNAGM